MVLWKQYHSPTSIGEALTILSQYGEQARIVAGGTDLFLDLQVGHYPPIEALVDVTSIPDIRHIQRLQDERGDWIVIGAAVTHTQIERSPLLQKHSTVLVESCSVVGGPQVRNVATLGGNVAHALPAADGTIGLLALDAEVQVCTWQANGTDDGTLTCTWQPLLSIFAGPGRNTLAHNQMLGAFRFRPTGNREASAFDRIMRPQGVALPILGLGARLQLDETLQRVVDATIAIGPAGPVPFRATDAEQTLLDADCFSDAVVEAAIGAAQAQAQLRTSKHRASREYRHEMIPVLLRRVLQRAVARAQESAGGV
jgi:carbon-monoxide dehydrogenase medium subunit